MIRPKHATQQPLAPRRQGVEPPTLMSSLFTACLRLCGRKRNFTELEEASVPELPNTQPPLRQSLTLGDSRNAEFKEPLPKRQNTISPNKELI